MSLDRKTTNGRFAARLSRRRGFTLVELLVAISAGALVSFAAVLLSRNAVRLFQEEARISYAQVAVTMGLNRIGLDLEHAGRKSTKNPFYDTRVCAQSPSLNDWPVGMQRLAPVVIEPAADLPQFQNNPGVHTERITIAGDLDSGDNFVMNAPLPSGTGSVVVLQPTSRAIRRLTALVANGDITTRLQEIFRAGRVLRIEGTTSDYYGRIKGFNVSGNPISSIAVTLEPVPFVPMQPLSTAACAIKGFGSGWPVHVISRVRYEVRSLVNDAQFDDYTKPENPVAGDSGRTELVRVELAPDDTEVPGTLELVTEYAVSLRFGVTTQTNAPTGPLLTRFPIGDAFPNEPVYTQASAPALGNDKPQMVRAVQVRLSTRSRAPDRPRPVKIGQPLSAGRPPFTFYVNEAVGPDKYARMRTVEREFSLVNTKGDGS